jgi:hypothetical protein
MCRDSYYKTCDIEFQTSFNKEQWARPNHSLIAKSNVIDIVDYGVMITTFLELAYKMDFLLVWAFALNHSSSIK